MSGYNDNDPYMKMRRQLIEVMHIEDKTDRMNGLLDWMNTYIKVYRHEKRFAKRDTRVIHDFNHFEKNLKFDLKTQVIGMMNRQEPGTYTTEFDSDGTRIDKYEVLTLEQPL